MTLGTYNLLNRMKYFFGELKEEQLWEFRLKDEFFSRNI